MKKARKFLLMLLPLFLLNACAAKTQVPKSDNKDLTVHFVDVGQGDCTVVVSEGHVMLIDCGDTGVKVQNYLNKQGIEKLDYLVLTHPDSDHIGGAAVVVTKFEIGTVFMSGYEKETSCYEQLIKTLEYKRQGYTIPKIGETYQLGNAEITFYVPTQTHESPNNNSLMLTVKNGDNVFLFTGDAEEEEEEDVLKQEVKIKADVYHVGHHGSETSSSNAFFEAVKPTYAVISCEKDNEYGHPHKEIMDRLVCNNTGIYRTDEQGTIIAVSDGKKITWNVESVETCDDNIYICNTNSKKFHLPTCEAVEKIRETNKRNIKNREEIIKERYQPCKLCNP